MDDTYPIDPPLDAIFILIAELMREGVLDARNITSMVRRLRLSELPDLAHRMEMLHFSVEMDTPERIRSEFGVIEGGSDGGKTTE